MKKLLISILLLTILILSACGDSEVSPFEYTEEYVVIEDLSVQISKDTCFKCSTTYYLDVAKKDYSEQLSIDGTLYSELNNLIGIHTRLNKELKVDITIKGNDVVLVNLSENRR